MEANELTTIGTRREFLSPEARVHGQDYNKHGCHVESQNELILMQCVINIQVRKLPALQNNSGNVLVLQTPIIKCIYLGKYVLQEVKTEKKIWKA